MPASPAATPAQVTAQVTQMLNQMKAMPGAAAVKGGSRSRSVRKSVKNSKTRKTKSKSKGTPWTEFVKKKGSNEEIIRYYQDQQEKLTELIKESKLKTLVLDMTSNNYDNAVNEITKEIGL